MNEIVVVIHIIIFILCIAIYAALAEKKRTLDAFHETILTEKEILENYYIELRRSKNREAGKASDKKDRMAGEAEAENRYNKGYREGYTDGFKDGQNHKKLTPEEAAARLGSVTTDPVYKWVPGMWSLEKAGLCICEVNDDDKRKT